MPLDCSESRHCHDTHNVMQGSSGYVSCVVSVRMSKHINQFEIVCKYVYTYRPLGIFATRLSRPTEPSEDSRNGLSHDL